MACEEIFLEKLRARGLRLTPQREMILSAMHEMEGLTTAEAIHEQVQSITSAVDISTVYRTLDLLQAFDIVACVDPGDGQHHYELLGVHGPHIHLICQSCGKIAGIDLEEARPFAERIRARYGFETDLDHLSIPGLCSSCAEQAAESGPDQASQ